MTNRFQLSMPKTNGQGYNGYTGAVVDTLTGERHRVHCIATDGHGASFYCAFETKEQLIKAAQKLARRLMRS